MYLVYTLSKYSYFGLRCVQELSLNHCSFESLYSYTRRSVGSVCAELVAAHAQIQRKLRRALAQWNLAASPHVGLLRRYARSNQVIAYLCIQMQRLIHAHICSCKNACGHRRLRRSHMTFGHSRTGEYGKVFTHGNSENFGGVRPVNPNAS